jgi:hypothetical protein
MAQIPILSGIYTDEAADFRSSYPINLMPVPMSNGISPGYLRPADGIVQSGSGPGICRGGINWNGVCYRVMGTKLVSIASDGTVTTLGDVGGAVPDQCVLDYSFDRLAIASGGNLFYWDGATLTQVTDPDLGVVLDFVWVDSYFMTTDGEFLVVTDINNPLSVSPLNYASSEIDPDPINSVMKLRNEIYAVNRYTIELFQNVGGNGFPFQRQTGAQIQKGSLGTFCSCVFMDMAIAFIGSGRNESPAIYLGANASVTKISTREIDEILAGFTETQLSVCLLESKNAKGQNHLWVHLPDRTLVYDAISSQIIGQPVWFILTSGLDGYATYRAKDLVWCYDRWLIGDISTERHGYLNDLTSEQWALPSRWEFGTTIVYGEGRGVLFRELELVCLTGRVSIEDDPIITTAYSIDGEVWSQEKPVRAGRKGDRVKRIVWFFQGFMENWRIQRFRGTSDAFLTIARLEAQLEPLAV